MINNKAHLVFLCKCDENEHAIGVESAGANAKGKTLMIKVIATTKNKTLQRYFFLCTNEFSSHVFINL